MLDPQIVSIDVPYVRHDGVEFLARVYHADTKKQGRPAVVDVHPGGWSTGDRLWGKLHDEALARQGFVVVALDFRQGPRYSHPAGSADVATGVRWVRAASEPLGVDPNRIALVGSSSGGHLAMLASCRPNAPEHAGRPLRWNGTEDVPGEIDATVSCVAALWPPVDPLARYRLLLEQLQDGPSELKENYTSLRPAMESYFESIDTMRAASVTRIVRSGEASHLPPAWVCYPALDQSVPISVVEDLEAAWREAGASIAVSLYEGQSHAFGHHPGPATQRFVVELADFLRRATREAIVDR